MLTNNPPPPLGLVGILGLSLSATDIRSQADFSVVFPNREFATGSASFGSLILTGALIGTTLTFSGDAPANTVLFSNQTTTVTLDQQSVANLTSCTVGAGCIASPVASRRMRRYTPRQRKSVWWHGVGRHHYRPVLRQVGFCGRGTRAGASFITAAPGGTGVSCGSSLGQADPMTQWLEQVTPCKKILNKDWSWGRVLVGCSLSARWGYWAAMVPFAERLQYADLIADTLH